MPTVLITGASRGIGLEFARQYAAEGWRTIATCRNPATAEALNAIGGDIEVRKLDVSDLGAIDRLAAELTGTPIDVLVLNAGLNPQPEAPPAELTDYDVWPEAFKVNCMAPLRCAVAFADHVASSQQKVITAITSGNSSIARNPGRNYVYRSTKAALNLCMAGLSREFKDKGLIIFVLSPGRVATDMGGHDAPRKPDVAIADLRAIIAKATPADAGRAIHFDGTDLPW